MYATQTNSLPLLHKKVPILQCTTSVANIAENIEMKEQGTFFENKAAPGVVCVRETI